MPPRGLPLLVVLSLVASSSVASLSSAPFCDDAAAKKGDKEKERKQTTQGRDGRTARRHHTGILRRGVWCASHRPPLGVRLFLSHFAVSLRFLPRPSCHLSVVPLSRSRKERKQTRQTRDGTRTGSPPARAGFWKDDQGDRWGSPAPDKGHDRLAARCAVDSHIHWRSHLSLATCLQLVAGSLSLPQAH